MPRSLTSKNTAEIAKKIIREHFLVYLGFSTPIRLSSRGSLEFDGNWYAGANMELQLALDGSGGNLALFNTPKGFQPAVIWGFNGSADSWTATNASISTAASTYAAVTASATDPQIKSPSGLSVDGSEHTLIRARIRRTAGSGWDGRAFYDNGTHGMTASYYVDVADTTVTDEWVIVEWDMSSIEGGGATDDWTTSTIDQIRLDLGSTASDDFDIDWIAIGKDDTEFLVQPFIDEGTAGKTARVWMLYGDEPFAPGDEDEYFNGELGDGGMPDDVIEVALVEPETKYMPDIYINAENGFNHLAKDGTEIYTPNGVIVLKKRSSN